MRRLFLILILCAPSPLSAQDDNREGLDFFEAKIRPMLVKHCYECHSVGAAAKKKLKGDEKAGADIVAAAVRAPTAQIAHNAGFDGDVVVSIFWRI